MPRNRKKQRGKERSGGGGGAGAGAGAGVSAELPADKSSPEYMKSMGNIAVKEYRFEDAIEWYTKAIEIDPNNKALYSNRSHTYCTRQTIQGFELALADAEKCITLDPAWGKGYYRQAVALKGLRRLPEAVLAAAAAVEREPSSSQFTALKTELGGLDMASLASAEDADAEKDVFDALEEWLTTPVRGDSSVSEFPLLYMKRYSEHNRGVHCRVDIPPETIIMKIPRRYLITVEMGKDSPMGRQMMAYKVDVTAVKHCYIGAFVLQDRLNMSSYFQPYYAILPDTYPNMPIFWDDEQLKWLEGSYLLRQIADRKVNIAEDRKEIIRACPDFAQFTVIDFMWARMMVASRNFGVTIDGSKTDALIPYADMLNHYRPRQTSWTFNQSIYAFAITTLKQLKAGQQVYDSYGKKCNSRFLLNYGFAVENNCEVRGQNHNEVRVSFHIKSPAEDPQYGAKMGLLDGSKPSRDIRVGTWYHHKTTLEAFSFCRFIHAEGTELFVLPQIGYNYDLGKTPIPPISASNEIKVLKTIAAVMLAQLSRYPRTILEDQADLDAGKYEMYSNHRNVLVVLRGEKEVCHFYLRLARVVIPLLRMHWKDCKRVINKKFKEPVALKTYIDAVVVPLVRKPTTGPDAASAGTRKTLTTPEESAELAKKVLQQPNPFEDPDDIKQHIKEMNRLKRLAEEREKAAQAAAKAAADELRVTGGGADDLLVMDAATTAGGAGGGAGAAVPNAKGADAKLASPGNDKTKAKTTSASVVAKGGGGGGGGVVGVDSDGSKQGDAKASDGEKEDADPAARA